MIAFAVFRLQTPNLCFLCTRVVYSMGQTRILIGEVSGAKVQKRIFFHTSMKKRTQKMQKNTEKHQFWNKFPNDPIVRFQSLVSDFVG